MDYLIAGLGNPGQKYFYNRHNIGFLSIDTIGAHFNIEINEKYKKSYIGKCIFNNKKILLMKPQTFMNLSGEMIRKAMATYKIPVQNLIIIHDDVDLPLNKIRIKKNGSDGGHKGVQSIIECLQNDNFVRIRLGINSSLKQNVCLEEFVLSDFSGAEMKIVKKILKQIPDLIETIINNSVEKAMNEFN